MRFEHKLSPAVAAYAQRARQQLGEIRTQYLIGLGLAKENELRAEIVRQALSQQLALVQEAEGLPAPVTAYELSDDGCSLVGEIESPEKCHPDTLSVGSRAPALADNGANRG